MTDVFFLPSEPLRALFDKSLAMQEAMWKMEAKRLLPTMDFPEMFLGCDLASLRVLIDQSVLAKPPDYIGVLSTSHDGNEHISVPNALLLQGELELKGDCCRVCAPCFLSNEMGDATFTCDDVRMLVFRNEEGLLSSRKHKAEVNSRLLQKCVKITKGRIAQRKALLSDALSEDSTMHTAVDL